jgi:hypothetical protein
MHNDRAVCGPPRSKHIGGSAFDSATETHDPLAFVAVAREIGCRGFGFDPRPGVMPSDRGPSRTAAR